MSNFTLRSSVMIEDDLTELHALYTWVRVVELKPELVCFAMYVWKLENMPVVQIEVKLEVRDLVPAADRSMLEYFYVVGAAARVLIGTLKPDSLEFQFVMKFDLNPRLIVVRSFPNIPVFLTAAQKILRLALVAGSVNEVLSSHCCLVV